MTRGARTCPTCHRPFPPKLIVHGPVRQRIVDAIENRPDGITRAELLDIVYGDDIDGGPNDPNTISVLIKKANEELAAQGYCISPAWLGRGARYRLMKIESRGCMRKQPCGNPTLLAEQPHEQASAESLPKRRKRGR
jgi:hypothetical protein